jgi:hypothetical protein
MTGGWSDEETDERLIADHRDFYKVEKWSRDGERVVELVFAGSKNTREFYQALCLIAENRWCEACQWPQAITRGVLIIRKDQ